MNRRTLLTAVGCAGVIGVSGCQRLQAVTDDGRRQVTIEEQDVVPKSHQLRISVNLLQGTITQSHTARLQLQITNTGEKRAVSAGPDACNLFNRVRGGSDDPSGLWLYQPEETSYFERGDGRWVPDRSQNDPHRFFAYGCTPTVYSAGKSVDTEFEVWDDHRVNGYLEPDTYRWEEDIQIWDDPTADGTDSPDGEFTWGFSLTVEAAD